MSTSNIDQVSSTQSNHPGAENPPPHSPHLESTEDQNGIPRTVEPLPEGSRLWPAAERDELSIESYRAGSATLVEVPVDGKPVMALLLSHELGQRMFRSVELQLEFGMLEDRFKEQIPAINHKLSHLQQIVDSTKSGLANVERINLGLVKQQDPKLVAMQSKAQEELLKDEEELELLEKEKAELERKVHDAKEAWFEFAWNVCVHHHIAFIKAGFKGEGGDSEDGETSSAESEPGEEASGAKESERKSSPTAAKDAQQPVDGNEMAMVLYTGNKAKQNTTTRNADVPQSKPPDLTMTRFTAEDEIRLKLLAAKKAFNKADDAHDNHRKCYELSFIRYCAQYPNIPEGELANQFPLYFIRKGQELINALRVAEKAYHEAENRALDANVFTIPDERIEANVNPYLDLDDLDAKLMPWTDKDRARIYNWRHVEAGILTPPSIHTIDTSYDASSSDDDDSTESVVSAQDVGVQRIEAAQPSTPPANNVATSLATPAQDEPEPPPEEDDIPEGRVLLTKPVASQHSYSSTELASTTDGAASSEVVEKRKFCGQIQGHDSFSVVDMRNKRQKIDRWQRDCARWRASNLHFE